jgi:GGDEF domain-containing protein
MNSAANRADIIVLAPAGELPFTLPPALAAARVRSAPLEALADLAAPKKPGPGGARQVLVAATASLGYRAGEILRAARSIRPEPEIYLLCIAAEEPQAMEMVAAGADDYFLAPDGFAELAEAVAGRGRHKEEHTLAPAKPGLQSVAPGGDILKSLSRIAELARRAPAEIAAGAVEALVGIEGLAGAGMLTADGRAALIARAGDLAEGAPAALGRKDWPRDEWLRADGDEWIWLDSSAEEPRLALVARLVDETPAAEFLAALSTVARVLLAVYATARQREAAVKVLSTDAETGLASRAYFDRYLAALCRRAAAQQAEAALILASPADAAPAALQGRLRTLGAIVQQSLGAVKVGRIGPDVLAAVVTGRGAAELKGQLQTLAAALARVGTAAAVGAAAYPWHASDGAELLLAAETALRASRHHGGVPVVAGALEDLPE